MGAAQSARSAADPLRDLVDLVEDMSASAERRPLDWISWTPPQRAFLELDAARKLLRAGNQVGKAQPVDEPVLTPTGWRPIGEIRPGDEVIAGDGTRTRVVAVYPQGRRPVFHVTFDDGTWTRCCDEHLWRVKIGKRQRFGAGRHDPDAWSVLPLRDIRAFGGDTPSPPKRALIPMPGAADLEERPTPLDPYLMGALLGDGGFTGSGLTFTNPEIEVLAAVEAALPDGCRLVDSGDGLNWRIRSDAPTRRDEATGRIEQSHPAISALRAMGLWGVKSEAKFIPDGYLWNTASARLAILQGLLDTDGHIADGGSVEFSTASPELAAGVEHLVGSLGGKAQTTTRAAGYRRPDGTRRECQPSHRVRIRLPGIDLFRLPRKAARRHDPSATAEGRVLRQIEPAGDAECVCIAVEHPDHTYVTRGFIVTHNTIVGIADVIARCAGSHPYARARRPPIEAWIVCTSWQQSVAIMGKFHGLCPPDLIDDDESSRYTRRSGYGKENPTVVFKNGSIVRFKTTKQGAEAVASGTVDVVLIDEPTTQEVYRELTQRVKRRGGVILITMTPVNAPCEWLHELVDRGVVEEVHARLTAENLTPVGSDRPLCDARGVPMDAAWVAEQWRITLPRDAPVVLDGEWEIRPEGVALVAFDPKRHVSDRMILDASRGLVRWVLGIDYAAANRDYGQIAILAQVQQYQSSHRTPDGRELRRTREAILVTDEVCLSGLATSEQFAQELLRMLDRQGLRWHHLSYVHGDNPVYARYAVKSNLETRNAIARELGVSRDAVSPPILGAKEGRQSRSAIDVGISYLHERIVSGEFIVAARCVKLIEAMQTWEWGPDHPAKDRIDALRYALKPYVFPARHGPAPRVRLG